MTIAGTLTEALENEARWRDVKADEFPDDPRNAQSAAAIRTLAAYVGSLGDDDYRIDALRYLTYLDRVDVPMWGESIINRLGFNQPLGPVTAALQSVIIDLAEHYRSNLDPTDIASWVDNLDEDAPFPLRLAAIGAVTSLTADLTGGAVKEAIAAGWSYEIAGALLNENRRTLWRRHRVGVEPE